MACWLASKQKNSSAATEIFEGSRSREREEVKMEGVRMGAEKTLLEIE